jgi:hypothetical protein
MALVLSRKVRRKRQHSIKIISLRVKYRPDPFDFYEKAGELESTIKKNMEHLDFELKRGDFGQ